MLASVPYDLGMDSERRRADRHPVDVGGTLFLSEGRVVPVRIKNIGPLGVMLQVSDLEEPVLEGERAVVDHPVSQEGETPTDASPRTKSVGIVVRVELEFDADGIMRQLAVYFDGGTPPSGYTA